MTADVERFRNDLAEISSVALDSNVLIYHLEGLSPYVELTTVLIAQMAAGQLQAVISTVSVVELLVGPHREGSKRKVKAAREFVEALPQGAISSIDLVVAAAAAPLRARGVRMPDALILATAVVAEADAVITNDRRLKSPQAGIFRIFLLDDYL
jgi:predicted nucleic acid-binding protein